jgi:phospholipid-binding lipoprotein MlaA
VRFVMAGIDERVQHGPELEEIERSSVDFYAQLRSIWRQNRANELRNVSPESPAAPGGLYEDPSLLHK